jgi:1,4-alpha-glucan branching enzyme
MPRKLHCLALSSLLIAMSAGAQSSRPGWGSTPYHDTSGSGVTFRVCAPDATSVYVPGQFNGWSTTANPLAHELTNGTWQGVWSADVPTASAGQQYKYNLNYGTTNLWKHDPRSRLVTYSGSASGANDIIYDPTAFNWSGDNFTTPALSNLVVYELHMGTFPTTNVPSRFVAATNQLPYLKQLGFTAVEVLPIAEFPGDSGWGYNPAQPYAVENIGYGGPDGLKTFVKAAHAIGLAVFIDVVHNHYGPSDLDLWDFDGWAGGGNGGGIYFYQQNGLCCTPYGSRPNYSTQQVRDYIQQNFQMLLDEGHVDGFRWDTPGLMMNASGYGFVNDAATLIQTITGMIHSNYPGKIDIAEDVVGYGFDSTWDLDFHSYITPQLTTSTDSNRDMTAISYAVTNNTLVNITAGLNRVAFLESHDIVGALNGGVRLPTSIDSTTPNSYYARKRSTLGAAITFTSPGVPMIFQGQEMLETNAFDSSLLVDWSKTNTYSKIVRFYHDLIRLRRNLDGDAPGLQGNQCAMLQVDNSNKLVAYRRWQSGTTNRDVVVIANFANVTWNNYSLPFPEAGNWYVHLNSDSTNYGSDYGNAGSTVVSATGTNPQGTISIAPYSVLILSQTTFPPQLTITESNSTVTVSWPAAFSGWTLSSSPSPGNNRSSWTSIPSSQYHTNGATIFFTTAPTAASTFYQLSQP